MADRQTTTEPATDAPTASGKIGRGPILPPPAPEDATGSGPGVEIEGVKIRRLKKHEDARGWLVELFRHDELEPEVWPRMAYASVTLPGVARGPHEHRDQTDGFVFFGPSDFRLDLWDARPGSPTEGRHAWHVVGASDPAAVWVPPGVVHAYRNVGEEPGLVFNAPNRLFAGWGRRDPVDEIRHENQPDSPYRLD